MEVHYTVNKCIECVVLANTYVLTGIVLRTTLANDDVTSLSKFTSEELETESF